MSAQRKPGRRARTPKVVTLVSGGLDSSLLTAMLVEEGWAVVPLFVDYGQLARRREWSACVRFHRSRDLPEPTKIDLRGFGAVIHSGLTDETLDVVKDAFLPGRNLMFILTGAAWARQHGADAIALGLLNEERSLFPDQTERFLNKAQELIELAVDKPIRIMAPLMALNKADVVALARERGIGGTYSCHAGGAVPCGVCISCREFGSNRPGGRHGR